MKLCPAQQKAFDDLVEAMDVGNVFVLWAHSGMGHTTILQELQSIRGGEFLSIRDFIEDIRVQNPLAMEETLERLLARSLAENELVIMDDLNLIYSVICGCGFDNAYPRAKFVEAILTSIVSNVSNLDKKIVFGIDGSTPSPIRNRCYYATVRKFDAEDYKFIAESYLCKQTQQLDFAKIHRFAPKLNAHQIRSAAVWLNSSKSLDTEQFIEYHARGYCREELLPVINLLVEPSQWVS